jgi:hypothetical protein
LISAIFRLATEATCCETSTIRSTLPTGAPAPADERHRRRALQQRPLALIEPGEGSCREAKEARSRVAVATWRGPDEGVAARTKPGDHHCE